MACCAAGALLPCRTTLLVMRRNSVIAIVLFVVVVTVFLVGSVLIDSVLPAGPRSAMVVTAPGHTGSLIRDWLVTWLQLIVLAGGATAAIALVRRRVRR